jgi:hypothetical protein
MNDSISHLSHIIIISSSEGRGAPRGFEKRDHLQTKLAGTTQAGKKSTKNKKRLQTKQTTYKIRYQNTFTSFQYDA